MSCRVGAWDALLNLTDVQRGILNPTDPVGRAVGFDDTSNETNACHAPGRAR